MMAFRDLIEKNRSYRRFHQDVQVSSETLRDLVDLARLSASASNRQPLRFYLSNDVKTNAVIFSTLKWAGYLRDWPGPAEGERPSAYIILLNDTEISKTPGCDQGIAAQSIMLGAVERDLGGCMIGSVDREQLSAALRINPRYEIVLVLALGKPAEKVQIEPVGVDGDIRYWRDEAGIHHVPKRALDDLLI
jgi:nitroreductase